MNEGPTGTWRYKMKTWKEIIRQAEKMVNTESIGGRPFPATTKVAARKTLEEITAWKELAEMKHDGTARKEYSFPKFKNLTTLLLNDSSSGADLSTPEGMTQFLTNVKMVSNIINLLLGEMEVVDVIKKDDGGD